MPKNRAVSKSKKKTSTKVSEPSVAKAKSMTTKEKRAAKAQ